VEAEATVVTVVAATEEVVAVEIKQYDIKWRATDIQYVMLMLKRAFYNHETNVLTLRTPVTLLISSRKIKIPETYKKYNLVYSPETRSLIRGTDTPISQEELAHMLTVMVDIESLQRQKNIRKKDLNESGRLSVIKEQLLNELSILSGSNTMIRRVISSLKDDNIKLRKEEEFIPDADETIYLESVIKPERIINRSDLPDPVNHKRECNCNCWEDTILNP
jgi:hypothetical protein